MSDEPVTVPEIELRLWPYEVAAADVVASIIFQGAPLGKGRPRFTTGGHAYTPETTRRYEAALRVLFAAEVGIGRADGDSRFALRCRFYRPNRQRIDCDNLLKAVCDSANGIVWADDSQVVEVCARLVLAAPHPRAEALIYRVADPSPSHPCERCGKEVGVWHPSRPTRFCSKECRFGANRITLRCSHCSGGFTLAACHGRRALAGGEGQYCSRSCARAARWAKAREKAGPNHRKCEGCGVPVSKAKYRRCRDCFAGRNKAAV